MSLAIIKRQTAKMAAELATLTSREKPALARLRADPARLLAEAGLPPDPWQVELLRRPSPRTLLLCSRQAGKSTVAAALALRAALLHPPALVLLLSPTLRQSGELFRDKVLRLYNSLGRPVAPTQETQLTMTLANGSRIASLPGEESTIRGFSGVSLIVIDEAARVPDDLYRAVRPMLAVSGGSLIALSTPFGKRGFFYEAWTGKETWQRVEIKAAACSRLTPEFLDEERRELGERWYRQEYDCSFEEVIDAVFAYADIQAALSGDVKPLFA